MSTALERTIMEEIGLGGHYNSMNGSPTCVYIRQEAVKKLGPTIKKYHKQWKETGKEEDKIGEPNESLIALVKEVAKKGDTRVTLTNTWQVASEVIVNHIHYAKSPEEERQKVYEQLYEFLKIRHLPRSSRPPQTFTR